MTGPALCVLLSGEHIGDIEPTRAGRHRFTYRDTYRERPDATPLSLSMPLTAAEHGHRVVDAFLWGVLPDNLDVLRRWGRDHGVSDRNAVALLRHVGEDCAGAVQFVRPERRTALEGPGPIEWMTRSDVAQRLRTLRADPTAWHASATSGQFSLAGAQAKIALFHEDGRWGAPAGRTPTTHILKPAVTGFDDHDLNEHLCLQTARQLGLAAARTWIEDFEGERATVVERFDRTKQGDGWRRIHQEDLCQALGVPPDRKYEAHGGPSASQIIDLLRDVQPPDEAERSIWSFVDGLALNWALAGTDAHAKNYAVLLAGPRVRWAPLYDVASALPYDDLYVPRLKSSMKIGGEYRLRVIERRHWERFAGENSLSTELVVERVRGIVERLPDALESACHDLDDQRSGVPDRMVERARDRAGECQARLSSTRPS